MIHRVRDRATFDALRRQGRRGRHGPVTVTFLPGEPPTVRAAFAISRNVGNAVVRNRVRRRLRAILRDREPGLAPGTYLLSVRPEAATLAYSQLAGHVAAACSALDRQGARP